MNGFNVVCFMLNFSRYYSIYLHSVTSEWCVCCVLEGGCVVELVRLEVVSCVVGIVRLKAVSCVVGLVRLEVVDIPQQPEDVGRGSSHN